jgi:hypothetical protein
VGFEYRSRRSVLGVPWIHVAWGVDPFTGRLRVARAVVAVGPIALGPIAIGPVAVGIVALGQLAVGVAAAAGQLAAATFAAGQLALGAIHAAGQLAAAPEAAGPGTWGGGWAGLPAAAVWLVVAAALGRAFWVERRRLARLTGTFSRIASAKPGAALLMGRVVPLRTVEAPVSRTLCIAYDVRRLQRNLRPRAETACEDFVVEDGTGRARVLASDAVVLLEPQRPLQAVQSRAVASVEGAGGGVRSSAASARAAGPAVERVLVPGDTVVVAGQALRSFTASGSQLAVQGGGLGPVLVTNRDPVALRAELAISLWLAAPILVSAVLTCLLVSWR